MKLKPTRARVGTTCLVCKKGISQRTLHRRPDATMHTGCEQGWKSKQDSLESRPILPDPVACKRADCGVKTNRPQEDGCCTSACTRIMAQEASQKAQDRKPRLSEEDAFQARIRAVVDKAKKEGTIYITPERRLVDALDKIRSKEEA